MLFLVGGWMLKRRRNARCTAVADSVLMNSRTNAKNRVLHSSYFAVNWRCCTAVGLGERSRGGVWKFRTFSFKYYVDHSHTVYSSGNIDLRNWVHLFESPCISDLLCPASLVKRLRCGTDKQYYRTAGDQFIIYRFSFAEWVSGIFNSRSNL